MRRYLGQVIARRYRVDGLLGSGSVGAVFRCTDLEAGAVRALKLLMPRGFSEPRAARRLRQEFRALSRLDNPHIVRGYELSETSDGVPFLVLEYVQGHDLGALLDSTGRLSAPRTMAIVVQLLDALEAAHTAGIVHRDLKPENIYLTRLAGTDDFIKVLDFGLVKFFDLGEGRGQPTVLTAHNLVVGTPHYMAPEQIRGGRLGPWTALYALGVLMYRMVTGELPFSGDDPVAVMGGHCRKEPLSPRFHAPDAPPALEALILELMEKDPAYRPRSAAQVRSRIEAGGLLPARLAPQGAAAWTGGQAADDDGPATLRQVPRSAALNSLPTASESRPPALALAGGEDDMDPTLPQMRWSQPEDKRVQAAIEALRTEEPVEPGHLWLVALVWLVALLTGLTVVLLLYR